MRVVVLPRSAVVDWNDPNVGLGCGTIHSWDPRTKQVKLLTTLKVMGNRGSGSELVKNEEGLVGITLDPNFTDNGFFYVFWMPHESIDRVNRVGQRTVSRFTYDKANQSIDQATSVKYAAGSSQPTGSTVAARSEARATRGVLRRPPPSTRRWRP